MQRVREQATLRMIERDPGFIARGLDAQSQHGCLKRSSYQRFDKGIAAAIIRAFRNSDGTPQLMPTVRVKENEPFEVAMRRFKRTVEKTGLLTELRAREFYEKP